MDDEQPNQPTHFWFACPGCGYGGEIGVPVDYASDVVVCPKCRDTVNVRQSSRILWRPLTTDDYLSQQFPAVDWDSVYDEESAPVIEPVPTADCQRGRNDRENQGGVAGIANGLRILAFFGSLIALGYGLLRVALM